jgi:hypothetical protein
MIRCWTVNIAPLSLSSAARAARDQAISLYLLDKKMVSANPDIEKKLALPAEFP